MDASLPQLVSDYGYLAVFVGTLLEGEAILLLAAYAAHQGYLSLPAVVGVAFCGATLGDQIFFFSGRLFGDRLLRRLPVIGAKADKINAPLLRYREGLIIGIRFAYGACTPRRADRHRHEHVERTPLSPITTRSAP